MKLTEIYISDDYQNSYTYLPVVKYGCSNNQETWEMSWFGSKQDQVNIHTTIRVYYSKLEWINYSKLSGQIVQISKYTKLILPVRWHTTPPILSSIKSSPCGPQIYLQIFSKYTSRRVHMYFKYQSGQLMKQNVFLIKWLVLSK